MHPPYYRGCWHGVSRCLFLKYRQNFFLEKRGLQTKILRPSRGIAPSDFRPLRKIPHCCLPEESGPCLSPSVGDHPLRPPSYHRLGKPLPYQLTNSTQTHLYPAETFNNCDHAAPLHYAVLAPLSQCYPPDIGRLSTRYSPVRQSPVKASFHLLLRLACVKPAASVRPEPGSNSPL